MSHFQTVPPKKDGYELAVALDELIKVVPLIEAQRELIKEAADRLRYLED